MDILANDQLFIFELVDKALQKSSANPHFFVTLSRFGQKYPMDIVLGECVDVKVVHTMSVHAASNITSGDTDYILMWSRTRLQDLCGLHGNLFSCLGMHEAINFQSNLNGKSLDFARQLQTLCVPGTITVLQLYADSPHMHLKCTSMHPVSGTIITAGLSHPNFHGAMMQRARTYLEHMEDLISKLPFPISLREGQIALLVEAEVSLRSCVPLGSSDPQKYGSGASLCLLW
ncbi:hypothetical protein ABVT39_004956 [Epinephelus coioides]